MNDLNILLSELNKWLEQNNLNIELIVIGAYALHLHGIKSRMTMDIDTLNNITLPEVQKKIQEIGKHYGLPEWLNSQASGMILPDGFYSRTEKSNIFSNIDLKYASRIDLIKLKFAAYYYRHEFELKDLDDLRLLNVSKQEFEDATIFLKSKHRPDQDAFIEKFNSDVDSIMKQLEETLFG